ncbi:MAG: nucleotidyltransferase substrate binding protein [Lachnospiraceae bacterium]|nr:nucleotidyltransferase substrate binding protein [Lachnospiraceae bacterium]
MESKFINRYRSFCDSLSGLEKARMRDPEDEFVLSGTAQKFNLTFDLSWKVMKDILVKYHKIQDFATGSPRETLRTAYTVGLISDDDWMRMLTLRNNLAHDYDGCMVRESFDVIVNDYVPLFQEFQRIAGGYMAQMADEK